MHEKPILFSTEMVNAILQGKKTQTRRIINPQPFIGRNENGTYDFEYKKGEKYISGQNVDWISINDPFLGLGSYCPFGYPGDELWVKETFKPVSHGEWGWIIKYKQDNSTQEIERLFPHENDDKEISWGEKIAEEFHLKETINWRPSIFMPRNASRIQLKIIDIRIEHLQWITDEDALFEGCLTDQNIFTEGELKESFHQLWDSINIDRGYGWDKNPWVWVIDFEVKNIKS